MADLIVEYNNLNKGQRESVKEEEGDYVIEQERLQKMNQEVEKANQRKALEEKHYESNFPSSFF